MRRADLQARAATRRDIALRLREAGATWGEVGTHLGVTAGRAVQIAKPTPRRKPGNPTRPQREPGGTTLGEYIERRARAVDECAEAVARKVRADE